MVDDLEFFTRDELKASARVMRAKLDRLEDQIARNRTFILHLADRIYIQSQLLSRGAGRVINVPNKRHRP